MKRTLKLTSHVICGWLDNRQPDGVLAELQVAGRDTPVALVLGGNCWRDLAGCRLEFRRRGDDAVPITEPLPDKIEGSVGDITATRKQVADQFSDQEVWSNCFSLEFFDSDGRRYLIEGHDFELRAEAPVWMLDSEEEAAQRMSNQQAMRRYVQACLRREESEKIPDSDDEYAWEERLQYSDRMNDLYDEVMEKFAEDEDSESKEAFVMGWDHLLGALADESESRPAGSIPSSFEGGPADAIDFGEMDWETLEDPSFEADYEFEEHPLQQQANTLLIEHAQFWELAKQVSPEATDKVYKTLLQTAGQLAAALSDRTSEEAPGYSLAVLKRCTNWTQEALSNLPGIDAKRTDSRRHARIQQEIFQLREAILQVRAEIKGREQN